MSGISGRYIHIFCLSVITITIIIILRVIIITSPSLLSSPTYHTVAILRAQRSGRRRGGMGWEALGLNRVASGDLNLGGGVPPQLALGGGHTRDDLVGRIQGYGGRA